MLSASDCFLYTFVHNIGTSRLNYERAAERYQRLARPSVKMSPEKMSLQGRRSNEGISKTDRREDPTAMQREQCTFMMGRENNCTILHCTWVNTVIHAMLQSIVLYNVTTVHTVFG